MSTAIHVRTESADHYNFADGDDLTCNQVLGLLKAQLGEEYAYISEITAVLSSGDEIDIDFTDINAAYDAAQG